MGDATLVDDDNARVRRPEPDEFQALRGVLLTIERRGESETFFLAFDVAARVGRELLKASSETL